MKGRAIYRWERDDAVPSKRNLAALVTALRAVNPDVAAWLEQAIAIDSNPSAAAAPAAPRVDEAAVVEHAVFTMADELDLPPRRVRHALRRLIKRLSADKLTLDATRNDWMSGSRRARREVD